MKFQVEETENGFIIRFQLEFFGYDHDNGQRVFHVGSHKAMLSQISRLVKKEIREREKTH